MEPDNLTRIVGSCHCENIRYTLDWPNLLADIPVRECGCTFCRKHGGAWTSNREAALRIIITDQSLVSAYQFGTATAIFHVCGKCGVVPFVTSEIDDHLYAVVNTNTFGHMTELRFSRSSTDFEGEGAGDRLERRRHNWIPDVQVSRREV